MIEQDTIRLLRECDAGVQMGIESLDDVRNQVRHPDMKEILVNCKKEHEKLCREIEDALDRFKDDGKDPNPIAEGMSKLKTEWKMRMKDSDSTVAELMTDGCNMGVKSLSRYLNQYKAADESAKDIAKRLIALEEKLAVDLRSYL
ncbi:MAG: hypothetical protein E7580_01250 [Ruminococcaceae bacterium]|nr:hypothetical protein [Oscillospiraceae bacterium]